MTGANYMGGKRNAAKARSKDSTGRIQRRFFGRQRLNMLSKGIPRQTPASPTDQRSSIPMIELAHAPGRLRDLDTQKRMDGKSPDNTRTTFVPVLKTPESRRAKESLSSSSGRSRVLDVLDTKEPMFLRATLNRILTLPDLAGLSGTGCASKRHRVEEDDVGYVRDERKRMKTAASSNDDIQPRHPQLTPSGSSVSSPRDPGTWLRDNRGRAITQSLGDGIHAPPKDDELPDHLLPSRPTPSVSHSDHPRAVSSGVSSLPPSSEQVSSSDLAGTVATGAAMNFQDQDWNDSGFDLDFERQHWTSSPQNEYEQSPTRSMVSVPSQDDGYDEIAVFNGSPRRCPRFAENNLYEHQDPWHTIGVILGLSPVRSDDRLLDEAFEEQDVPFSRFTRSLYENVGEHDMDLDEYIPTDVRNSDESTTQNFWATEDELEDDLNEEQKSEARGSACASWQTSLALLGAQDNFEEPYDTQIMATELDFEALSHANVSPGSVRAPSPVEEPQSPFRILLESKRNTISSVNSHSSSSFEVYGSSAPPQSSSSRSRSSLAPRTPSPRVTEETQSPFRMLLAARNLDRKQEKTNLNLTDYSLGDPDAIVPWSSPGMMTFDFAGSTMLKEVDGVFQGPCLFPDDAYDASDED